MQFILCAISYSASIFCLVILKVNLGGEIFARISFKFFLLNTNIFMYLKLSSVHIEPEGLVLRTRVSQGVELLI